MEKNNNTRRNNICGVKKRTFEVRNGNVIDSKLKQFH